MKKFFDGYVLSDFRAGLVGGGVGSGILLCFEDVSWWIFLSWCLGGFLVGLHGRQLIPSLAESYQKVSARVSQSRKRLVDEFPSIVAESKSGQFKIRLIRLLIIAIGMSLSFYWLGEALQGTALLGLCILALAYCLWMIAAAISYGDEDTIRISEEGRARLWRRAIRFKKRGYMYFVLYDIVAAVRALLAIAYCPLAVALSIACCILLGVCVVLFAAFVVVTNIARAWYVSVPFSFFATAAVTWILGERLLSNTSQPVLFIATIAIAAGMASLVVGRFVRGVLDPQTLSYLEEWTVFSQFEANVGRIRDKFKEWIAEIWELVPSIPLYA